MQRKQNIIVDLDGTLALERHRREHILQSWEHYFAHIHLDPVNEAVLEVLDAMNPTHDIFIFTSRPERYRQVTVNWLADNEVPYDFMEMRAEQDTHLDDGCWQTVKSDDDVKLEMIARYRLGPANVAFVLEDRDQMCDFYRALGFDCWQVHPQHELYAPGQGLLNP
jgi:phosphoglycolate phosphatase-like HAD superfamily hydrolase